MHGLRGPSLSACLVAIAWSTAAAAPPPRSGVWWDQSFCPELRTKEDAPRVWSTVTANHLMRGKPPEPGIDLKENPEAMTLAQWAASGWEPYSTFDLAAQGWFEILGSLTTTVPLLREPTASALDPSEFAAVALGAFNDGLTRVKTPKASSPPESGGPSSEFAEGGFDHRLGLMAVGDLNGDGWQDWLIRHGARAQGGTMGLSGVVLVTRRGNGPLVDITNQLPDPRTGPAGLASWQMAKAALPAWPEGKPRAFTGAITVDGKQLGITMTLTCSNTVFAGTYRYDHVGKDIPLAGSVGADGSLSLHEFPGPGVGKARFELNRTDAGTWSGTWDNLFPGDMHAEGPLREGTVTLAPKR